MNAPENLTPPGCKCSEHGILLCLAQQLTAMAGCAMGDTWDSDSTRILLVPYHGGSDVSAEEWVGT